MFGLFGLPAYMLPLFVFGAALFYTANADEPGITAKIVGASGLLVVFGVICDLAVGDFANNPVYQPLSIYTRCAQGRDGGGILCGSIAFFLYSTLKMVGTVMVLIVASLIFAVLITQRSIVDFAQDKVQEAAAISRERREEERRYREEHPEDYGVPGGAGEDDLDAAGEDSADGKSADGADDGYGSDDRRSGNGFRRSSEPDDRDDAYYRDGRASAYGGRNSAGAGRSAGVLGGIFRRPGSREVQFRGIVGDTLLNRDAQNAGPNIQPNGEPSGNGNGGAAQFGPGAAVAQGYGAPGAGGGQTAAAGNGQPASGFNAQNGVEAGAAAAAVQPGAQNPQNTAEGAVKSAEGAEDKADNGPRIIRFTAPSNAQNNAKTGVIDDAVDHGANSADASDGQLHAEDTTAVLGSSDVQEDLRRWQSEDLHEIHAADFEDTDAILHPDIEAGNFSDADVLGSDADYGSDAFSGKIIRNGIGEVVGLNTQKKTSSIIRGAESGGLSSDAGRPHDYVGAGKEGMSAPVKGSSDHIGTGAEGMSAPVQRGAVSAAAAAAAAFGSADAAAGRAGTGFRGLSGITPDLHTIGDPVAAVEEENAREDRARSAAAAANAVSVETRSDSPAAIPEDAGIVPVRSSFDRSASSAGFADSTEPDIDEGQNKARGAQITHVNPTAQSEEYSSAGSVESPSAHTESDSPATLPEDSGTDAKDPQQEQLRAQQEKRRAEEMIIEQRAQAKVQEDNKRRVEEQAASDAAAATIRRDRDSNIQEQPEGTEAAVGDADAHLSSVQRTSVANVPAQQSTKMADVPQERPYVFPPMDLLHPGKSGSPAGTDDELRQTAATLQGTLQTFGVNVRITEISQGPAVTRYELQPEQGVKVSRILNLADDIKLALAAEDIRIEAPIPGKSAIGIEVPNKVASTVALREILDTPEFRNHKSRLAFGVGKDIAGMPVISDIAKMPHVLIAGATGSGKSVCINTIIMSILYHATPDEVKLILIDPKIVELSVYNGIPHLLFNVVTDPQKAAGALNWAVGEMTARFAKFADAHVRDIKGYNALAKKKMAEGETDMRPIPQIVIIVDELADLMMVAKNDVETAICRLAQLARAAGMHLVIATQRPSVDVITGLIKANMPSRIAFAVTSNVDSRTILDRVGAEKLLGKGDMLFFPQGMAKPARVQGAFVSDDEVADVVDFIRAHNHTDESAGRAIEQQIENMKSGSSGADAAVAEEGAGSDLDEYFEDAGKFIIEKNSASIGLLQRRFRIGFNRAARIMDELCDAGVVSESEGTKSRKILMTPAQFEEYCQSL